MKTNNGLVVLLYYPASSPRVFGPFQTHGEARLVLLTMDVNIPPEAPLVDGRVQDLLIPLGSEGYDGPIQYSWEVLEDPRLIFG